MENKKYIEGIHYRYFDSEHGFAKVTKPCSDYRYFDSEHGLVTFTKPCSESKRLFLTYKGLMLALFSSITPSASKFIDWACEVVFTAHMGTQEQKLALSADLIGLSKDQVKQFFDTCASEISGLYLIRLGTVGKLRKVFQIPEEYPDHLYVHKFGRSNNIATRFQQHVRSYAKLKIYDIKLIYYCPIDSELVPKAEADLRNHFDAYGMKLENDEHTVGIDFLCEDGIPALTICVYPGINDDLGVVKYIDGLSEQKLSKVLKKNFIRVPDTIYSHQMALDDAVKKNGEKWAIGTMDKLVEQSSHVTELLYGSTFRLHEGPEHVVEHAKTLLSEHVEPYKFIISNDGDKYSLEYFF